MSETEVFEEVIDSKVQSKSRKCPNCGGDFVYNIEKKSLVCVYCNHEIKINDNINNVEHDYEEGLKLDEKWNKDQVVFKCKFCGSESIKKAGEIVSKCPYCGSESIIKTDELPGIKPHRVIPFKVTKDEAIATFIKKAKTNLFVPEDFKKNFRADKVNGVYVPSWTFDFDTVSTFKGRVGDYYTITVGSGKNARTETRIRWRNISGNRNDSFDDLLVVSSPKFLNHNIEKVYPYDTNNAQEFNDEFLSGFEAEHYTISLLNGREMADKKADTIIYNRIVASAHCDVVDYIKVDTSRSTGTYKYVLLPVWFSFYRYKDKDYYFLVNGENGRLTCKMPKSAIKIAITVIIAVIIVVIAVIIYMNKTK